MKKMDDLQKMKFVEIITIAFAILGIILTIVHGNIYDYFFNLFSIRGFFNFRLLYVSLLLYSILALVIFTSLFLLNERNPEIRFYNYVQGWLFITLAAASYEWFVNMIFLASQMIIAKQVVEDPYTFFAKRASVTFFGAIFVIWILENRKNQIKNSHPI